MKRLARTIAMLLLGMLLFSTTAFAADVNKAVDEIESLQTQTKTDVIIETKQCSSSKGTVVAVVRCNYTGQWDEGYTGWINNAYFEISYATVGGTKCTATPDGVSWLNGSSAYQRYTINGVNILLVVTMDEWGDASLVMVEN